MRSIEGIVDETWLVTGRNSQDPDYWEVIRFVATGHSYSAIVHIRDFFESRIFKRVV